MQKIYYSGIFTAFFLMFTFAAAPVAAQTASGTVSDTVMVLPFENTSPLPSYNWVGESFAEALTDLFARLESRGSGLRVVPNDERKIYQQKLRLPLTTLPSLATSIKLAQQSKTTLLVLGKYSVTPAEGEVATSLRVTVRVVRVQDGAFVTELYNGKPALREIDLADAIGKLQTLQGQVAHQILYQREGNALSLSQNEVVEMAKRVPPRSFEAYTKAMLTGENEELRANFLKNALRFHAEEKSGEIYPQAALELGHFYLRQNNFQSAGESFGKVPKDSSNYAEAAFYAGLMQFNLKNEAGALDIFRQLAEATRLTAAFNNVGAISLQLSQNDKAENRAELLDEGLKTLDEAAKSAADDAVVKFNFAYALLLAKKYKDAASILREVILTDPRDGQSYFLLAKSLEKSGDATAAADMDNQARRYLTTYAKAQTEWQKAGTTGDIPFRLYKTFNRSDYLNLTRKNDNSTISVSDDGVQNKLQKAREFYTAGRDDEALAELRQLLVKDSMNADSYLLIGKIHLRRGDLEAAVSNLKTAIFWKNDLIEGHIQLGKIFLERGDFNMATTYAKNAVNLDSNNQEAVALLRAVERKTK